MDFITTLQNPIEFLAGGMPGESYCVNISIVDDMIVEEDEYFYASLQATNQCSVFHIDFTRIIILDNDGTKIMI